MKKFSLVILVGMFVVSTSSLSYARENFDYTKFNGISLGGGATVSSDISGGFVDFGFNFYTKKNDNDGEFAIRNYLEVMGGGTFYGGVLGFRERLHFSGTHAITDQFGVRGYGGMDLGISFVEGNESKYLFSAPYLLEYRGFGGIEFLFNMESKSGSSVFIEAGGGAKFSLGSDSSDMPIGIARGSAFITFGGRYYF